MTSRALLRRALAPAAAAAVVLAVGGCGQLSNPLQTDVAYQPADGVAVDMGPVQIRGMVVVAESATSQGVIVGSLVNGGGDDAEVSVSTDGGQPVTIEAPAYSEESMSTQEQVTLPQVGVEPGGVITLQVGTRDSGANVVQVPVLPPREYYAPFTPTSTPTGTATTTQPAG